MQLSILCLPLNMSNKQKHEKMRTEKFNYRGSEFNKVYFSDIEQDLEDKGFDVDECFRLMADEKECVYVSNGFLRGLSENTENNLEEWHHYFVKGEDGHFEAFKMNFFNA